MHKHIVLDLKLKNH